MSDLQALSPLAGRTPCIYGGFQLRALEHAAKLRVQALRSRGSAGPIADPALLPIKPNTVTGADPFVIWKAPDDWLVYTQSLSSVELLSRIEAIESTAPLVATDVSSATVILEITGTHAMEALMRDCTLDLEGDAVPPGACAQTLIAKTNVLLHRLAQREAWRLFVERSVARYVWDWFEDSASPLRGVGS